VNLQNFYINKNSNSSEVSAIKVRYLLPCVITTQKIDNLNKLS